MHHKNIKVIVRKQLKMQFPNWKRLGRKVKQTFVKQVLAEVEAKYDFSIPVTTSKEELLERWLRSFGQFFLFLKWNLCLLLGCLFNRRQHHGIGFVRCSFL